MLTGVVDGRYLRFSVYPDVFTVCAALAVGYWYAITRVGPARGGVTSRRQIVWWYASVATVFVFAEWPIHALAEHYSFAIHMLEHEVFVFAAAPMMLLGTPDWLVRWAVVERPWYGAVRFVSRPFAAGAFFTVVLLVGHWPAVVNEATHDEPFHFLMHLILFLSALALWMPVVNRLPEFAVLGRAATLLYLFVTSIPATLPTMMLIFSTHVLYTAYAGGPEYLGWGFKVDQEVAGAIMGVGVTVEVWILAAYHFFGWWAEEQRAEREERAVPIEPLPAGLTWADVEQQLAETTAPPST
jgi:cytochrome c oxidase assembly factor CtaG